MKSEFSQRMSNLWHSDPAQSSGQNIGAMFPVGIEGHMQNIWAKHSK